MKRIILLASCLFLLQQAHATIKLPALVGSHMVLQRDKPIRVWGYGTPGEKVGMEFNGIKQATVTAKNGKWNFVYPSMKAGGPYDIKFIASNTIVLTDILVGDVWVCSGQNNMEFPLLGAENRDEEIKNADFPQIRLFTIGKKMELKPADNVIGQWVVCTSRSVQQFSAAGYFFGRDLHKKLNVPIGLINASWSGTGIESWISPDGFKGHPTLEKKSLLTALIDTLKFNMMQLKLHEDWLKKFENSDTGKVFGRYTWASPKLDTKSWGQMRLPMPWEFSSLKQLKKLDGIVWFRRTVILNKADTKGPVYLNLGFIMNSDHTFVNGTEVGTTPDQWGKERSYLIPSSVLKNGENSIVVRVSNYDGDGGFAGHPTDFTLKTAVQVLPLSGLWAYKIGYRKTTNDRPQKSFSPNSSPSVAFNSKIQPLTSYSIKGIIWYHGESNTAGAFQYRDLFTRLINNFRAKFNDPELPFLYVQLANFHSKLRVPEGSQWAELREAQDLALKIPNTAMVTAIDIGDSISVHPKNKQELGRRLSLAAQQLVYKLPAISAGPHFDSLQVKKAEVFAYFKMEAEGLKIKTGSSVKGFQIAGADKVFYWADAQISGKNSVKISSAKVTQPVAIRYAWEDNPSDANLTNGYFPAFPFRSDTWNGITY